MYSAPSEIGTTSLQRDKTIGPIVSLVQRFSMYVSSTFWLITTALFSLLLQPHQNTS